MPSQRFMRLSGEKQRVIWEAAVQEFATQPYEKVSINKIIKQAGISRGSFYTYFEDKRDLLAFILWGTRQQWDGFCRESLKQTGGDFFEIMADLLDRALEFCRNNNLFSLHKNLIMYPEPLKDYLPGPEDCGCGHEAQGLLLDGIDRSRFWDPSTENVVIVFKMAAMLLLSTLSEFCLKPENEQRLREDFLKALGLLKHGAYRFPE